VSELHTHTNVCLWSYHYFWCIAQQPNLGRRLPHCWGFWITHTHTHTHTHTERETHTLIQLDTHIPTHAHAHTHGGTPLNVWSAHRRGRYLHNIQQTQETNTPDVRGIWTRYHSYREAADQPHRPYGHRDRPVNNFITCDQGVPDFNVGLGAEKQDMGYRGFPQAVRKIPVDYLSQATTASLHILAT